MNAPWTLPELTHRIDAILRSEGITQQNGQVAEAPNGRAIRWYQSTGLLRRPVQRGRTAYYGPLHLAEVVAIKRLQADGLSLADVQTRLQSLDDVALQALAALPPSPGFLADAVEIAHRQGQPFWSASFDDDTSDDDGNIGDDEGDDNTSGDDDEDHGTIATDVLATRRTVDHPSGVSITLPATISDDVARRFLARLVDDLAAESLLSTSTAPTSARSVRSVRSVRSDQPAQTPSPEDDQ